MLPAVATAPTPLSTVTLVAFVADQVRVVDCPGVILVALADAVIAGEPGWVDGCRLAQPARK